MRGAAVAMVLLWEAALLFGGCLCEEYRVAAIESPPFIMKKVVNKTVKYTGFIPDFLNANKPDNCVFKFVDVKKSNGKVDNTWDTIADNIEREQVKLGVGPVTKGRVGGKDKQHNVHYSGRFADHQGWTALIKPLAGKHSITNEAFTLLCTSTIYRLDSVDEEAPRQQTQHHQGSLHAVSPLHSRGVAAYTSLFLQDIAHCRHAVICWTALMRKPLARKRNIIKEAFTLFRPFTVEVWLAVVVAFAVVSVLLALVNLINPYEWRNLYKRDKISKADASQLSPMGSILIVFSTLTWQGYEKIPRSISGKVLLFFWFAFVAVTLSSYIGNMTHLLSCEAHANSGEIKPVIRDPYGLLDAKLSKGLKFGTVDSWPIVDHLKGHAQKDAKKLAEHLEKNGDFVHSVQEGLDKVRNLEQDYVFVIDTVIARYLTRDNCDVVMLDIIEPGDMKGYAIATEIPKTKGVNPAPVAVDDQDCVKKHLAHMTKNDDTQDLWKRWDNEYKYGRCSKRHERKEERPPKPIFVPINVYQFCGPLALVGLGIVLCILASIIEITVHYVANKLKKVNILGASSPIEEERRLHDDLDDDLKA